MPTALVSVAGIFLFSVTASDMQVVPWDSLCKAQGRRIFSGGSYEDHEESTRKQGSQVGLCGSGHLGSRRGGGGSWCIRGRLGSPAERCLLCFAVKQSRHLTDFD